MAALAGVTERVVIGPLVACLGFHPPGLIARMAAAIDEISGGRFVLGVGSGWNEPEFRAFGLPFDHRASRFLESFEIIRRLLAGERVTSEGRFWQVEDAVLLPPPARVTPIMLGTSGPAAARGDAALRRQLEHLVGRVRQHGRGLRRLERRDQRGASAPGGTRPRSSAAPASWSRSTPRPASARAATTRPRSTGEPRRIAARPARPGRGGRRRGDPGARPDQRGERQAVRRGARRARRLRALAQPAGRLIVWPPSTTITWPVT